MSVPPTFARVARASAAGVLTVSLLAVFGTAGALAAPTLPTQPSAQQQADGLTKLGIATSADGWFTYTRTTSASLGLADTKTTTYTGTRDADGLCLVGGAEASTSSVPTYSEETAFNPATCESKVFTGTITPAAASKLAASEVADSEVPAGATGLANASTTTLPMAKRAAPASTTSYQSAHTRTSWVDPLFITITRQTVNLKWPLYGKGGTLSSSYPAYKFKYDGWSVDGPHFSGFKKLSSDRGWYVSATSHFVNYDFAALVYALLGLSGWLACGAHSTTRADFYHYDKVEGRRNNSYYSVWSDKKSGACSNLVHHKTERGFGWK